MDKFHLEKREYVTKTFRLPESMVAQMQRIAQEKNISLTQMVIECCEYALNNLEEETPPEQ